jgi:hypothetical protein
MKDSSVDLNKLSILLCLAFQESEGPFYLLVKDLVGNVTRARLMKSEAKLLSLNPSVAEIDIAEPLSDRRHKERWTSFRRIAIRKLI